MGLDYKTNMTEMTENRGIEGWLRQEENLALLKKIAVKILYEVRSRCLEQYLLLDISNNDREDQVEEVLSNLVLFISEKKPIQEILFSGEDSMANEVKRSFINDIVDESRKTDQMKKLNRNCQAAVRESQSFFHTSVPGAGFCFYKKSSTAPKKVLLCDDDLKAVLFPFEICPDTDYKAVNRKKILIRLADWFYDQITEKTGHTALLIEMTTFVKWIGLTTILTWQVDSMDDGARPDGDGKKTDLRRKFFPELKKAADQEDKTEAANCAGAFANRLPDTEKEVFFLFYCENLSHKEVKEKMGRPSSLAYHKKKAETRLKEFLTPFTWAAVDSMMSFFLKRLCRQLGLTTY